MKTERWRECIITARIKESARCLCLCGDGYYSRSGLVFPAGHSIFCKFDFCQL